MFIQIFRAHQVKVVDWNKSLRPRVTRTIDTMLDAFSKALVPFLKDPDLPLRVELMMAMREGQFATEHLTNYQRERCDTQNFPETMTKFFLQPYVLR